MPTGKGGKMIGLRAVGNDSEVIGHWGTPLLSERFHGSPMGDVNRLD